MTDTKPTPLLLQYGEVTNCLHQDLYGNWYFRFRSRFLLAARDFTGGEFVLTGSGHACNRAPRRARSSRVKP